MAKKIDPRKMGSIDYRTAKKVMKPAGGGRAAANALAKGDGSIRARDRKRKAGGKK